MHGLEEEFLLIPVMKRGFDVLIMENQDLSSCGLKPWAEALNDRFSLSRFLFRDAYWKGRDGRGFTLSRSSYLIPSFSSLPHGDGAKKNLFITLKEAEHFHLIHC